MAILPPQEPSISYDKGEKCSLEGRAQPLEEKKSEPSFSKGKTDTAYAVKTKTQKSHVVEFDSIVGNTDVAVALAEAVTLLADAKCIKALTNVDAFNSTTQATIS